MERINDTELVRRCRAGDSAAFEEIVNAYQHMIYNLCLTRLRSREDALDTSQECFLKAYRAINSFRGDSKLSSWLYRIALNCINDHFRRSKDEISLDGSGCDEKPLELPDDEESRPEAVTEKNARCEAVRAAVASLAPEGREIIVLREFEGYSYSEIARILGVEEGTVKSRLNRAREKIKEFLSDGNFITR